ncbi:hypothetical protein [uncultured Mediterranean phage]|nr:hypothetical protein [uncultured Mediterranean phage]
MEEYKSRLSTYLSDMIREELVKYDGGYTDEWNDQRKKNAEVLGYKLSGKSDIKEGATEFWMDMFRPGPIPKKYINQLIKKKGELPSKKHIKKIYRDNGNPSSSQLAKTWKQLQKEKYVRAASGMWRWNADFTGWESVNEEITDWQGGYNDEFKFKKGQLIRDINPDCPHHGSEGEVTKVTKDEVTYTVRNNGKTYKVGDELTKTKDQLTPLSLKESVNEKISKEEWEQYPKYARKLKPYLQKLFKVPLKVRVIKQANENPWIEIRVARFGKDIIPNDFRKKALKVIGGSKARDMDNINYGNIRTNSVSLKHDQWVKLLGNKVKESVNEGGMGILTTDQADVLQAIVMKNKSKNSKAILRIVMKDSMFKGVDKREMLGYIEGTKQFVKYMKSHPMESVNEGISQGDIKVIDTHDIPSFKEPKHSYELVYVIKPKVIKVGGETKSTVRFLVKGKYGGRIVDIPIDALKKSNKFEKYKVRFKGDILPKFKRFIKGDKVLESINEAKRGTDLYFVIDQLVNSMEHYNSEREWLKHMGKETKYSSQQLKKLYKSYYKLSPQKRFSMSFNWEKWLKKQGITETSERDYKAEYKKYGSSTKAKKYRAELNQYNRKKGTYGNNDGKDASHKGGKIAGFEKESTNRGRREKSRLKKEVILKLRQMIREELGLGDYND